MQASAEHVQYQHPNEHSRVGFLLEVIQCSDLGLQAAMASIETDNGLEGMMHNFEATAAHLLPYDPVAKKRSSGQKRGSAQISSVIDPSPTKTKIPSIGTTGVHLHYYKTGEYRNLTNEQKEELKEWRANNPNTFKAGSKKARKEAPKKSISSMKKEVASSVEAALNNSVKFDDQVNDEEKYNMSMVQAAVAKTLNQKRDQQSQDKPKVSLKCMCKQAKINGSSSLNPVISTLTTSNEESCKSKLGKIKNNKVSSAILEGSETMEDVNKLSRTELDSHANMPVIGRNAYILSKIGETVDVLPYFTPDYKPISVGLVDAALKYECPYCGEVKILIIRRGLYVPSMTHNLLPPFMLREAGIHINEVPKIHVTSPTEEHHAITFQETIFQIPLTLQGTFSYFPTSKPSTQELEEPEDVYILTPTTWNPHSDAYVINEESMLDWEGNMKHEMDHENKVVVEDIP